MRQLREVLRLYFESHLTPRQIGSICKVSKSTVQRYLERLKSAGLSWPLPADLDDVALERRLFPPPPVASPEQRCLPDCAAIHKELKSRKNVTLQLLWEEYKQANPLGYACRDGSSVLYRSAAKLFRDLAEARADGSLSRLLESIARTDVLLVDDFAMAPLNDDERRSFLEVCDDRYGQRSTVLTSQLPVESWHAQIGDPTIADSILDRLVHNAYRIEMDGESIRKKKKDAAAELIGGRS